jgi:hypothetical protein
MAGLVSEVCVKSVTVKGITLELVFIAAKRKKLPN